MPMLPTPVGALGIIGPPTPADVHGARQAPHPRRDRSGRRNRRYRGHPPPRGGLLLDLVRLARQRDAGAFGALRRPGVVRKPPSPTRSRRKWPHSRRATPISHGALPARTPSSRSKKNCRSAGHPDGAQWRRALTQTVLALSPSGGMTAAVCAAVGVSRATVHRTRAVLTGVPAGRSRRHPVA
jgi:hypothetical protein